MAWRLAKSLETLRRQINDLYPNRDKTSDGSIGDARHASRKSDHNPWVKDSKGVGVVTATDTDEDISPDIHSIESIVSAIRASKDPRVKYIIYEGRITVAGSQLQRWKPYTGSNPHDKHAHISVFPDPKLYDDPRPWSLTISTAAPSESFPADSGASSPANRPPSILLKRGSLGQAVARLQAALVMQGFLTKAQIDSDFGPVTETAVRNFQRSKGLDPDGKAGPATLKELGL